KNAAAARWLPLVLCGLAAAELAWQGRRLYEFGPPEKLFPERPVLAYLRGQPGPFRVVGESDVLFPNTNVFAGLEDVRTHDAVERRDYVDYLDRTCGYPPSDYFKKIGDLNCRGLDLLNVRYLVAAPGRSSPGPKWKAVYSAPDAAVFENTAVLPRVVAEGAAIRDYQETTNGAAFHVAVEGPGEVELAASLLEDGGWSARDGSGRKLAVGRRPEAPLLTLRLQKGEHDVRLTYRPPLLREGASVTAATAAALAVWALRRRRRRGYGQVENAAVS